MRQLCIVHNSDELAHKLTSTVVPQYLSLPTDAQLSSIRPIRKVIFQLIVMIDGWSISCKIVLKWMPMDLTDGKPTLVQVMAWCRQGISRCLSQCWPRFLSPYGVIVGIDHVFSSGAVVGRATMLDWGRPSLRAQPGDPTSTWWRVQPQLLTQKRGQFPFYHDHLDRRNQMFEAELSAVKSVSPASSHRRLPRKVRRYARAMTSQWQTNVNKARSCQASTRRKTFKSKHFMAV